MVRRLKITDGRDDVTRLFLVGQFFEAFNHDAAVVARVLRMPIFWLDDPPCLTPCARIRRDQIDFYRYELSAAGVRIELNQPVKYP